jgi:seryl-tRNA synthetase
MLDMKFVRENADIVKESENRRGNDAGRIDALLQTDMEWKSSIKKEQDLRKIRNSVSEEINRLKKEGKTEDANAKIAEMKSVAKKISELESKSRELDEKRISMLKEVGNVLHKSVPIGKDDSENVEIRRKGSIPKFDYDHKDHIEIGLEMDLFDLDTAAEVAAARFYYLKNEAVLLDMALQRFAVDRLKQAGFTLISPPLMLNRHALAGTVNLSEFEDTIYKIEGEDLYLIGTSEHALIALKKEYTFDEKELPYRLGGISACFRKEAGSHGRDTKGIFRVHQFNKAEEILFCLPEDSYKYFEELQKLTEDMIEELEVPFRVVQICTGDIGLKQALQYDIEAWFPGQNGKKGAYREVTSCSNCTDYQAVTLGIRYQKKDNTRGYVHIINNTALATSRMIAALLENHQQKDGSIRIPKALQPYMGMDSIVR